MKNKIVFLSIFFILFSIRISFADSFILIINYTEGEKSKDSHSSDTRIEMTGNEVSYSKSYSGYNSGKDITKACIFTDEQTSNIQNFIQQNSLNKEDSLIQKTSKYKSYEVFVNLTIKLVMWENISKIKINGDTKEFKDKPLYLNSLELIKLIESYLDKC